MSTTTAAAAQSSGTESYRRLQVDGSNSSGSGGGGPTPPDGPGNDATTNANANANAAARGPPSARWETSPPAPGLTEMLMSLNAITSGAAERSLLDSSHDTSCYSGRHPRRPSSYRDYYDDDDADDDSVDSAASDDSDIAPKVLFPDEQHRTGPRDGLPSSEAMVGASVDRHGFPIDRDGADRGEDDGGDDAAFESADEFDGSGRPRPRPSAVRQQHRRVRDEIYYRRMHGQRGGQQHTPTRHARQRASSPQGRSPNASTTTAIDRQHARLQEQLDGSDLLNSSVEMEMMDESYETAAANNCSANYGADRGADCGRGGSGADGTCRNRRDDRDRRHDHRRVRRERREGADAELDDDELRRSNSRLSASTDGSTGTDRSTGTDGTNGTSLSTSIIHTLNDVMDTSTASFQSVTESFAENFLCRPRTPKKKEEKSCASSGGVADGSVDGGAASDGNGDDDKFNIQYRNDSEDNSLLLNDASESNLLRNEDEGSFCTDPLLQDANEYATNVCNDENESIPLMHSACAAKLSDTVDSSYLCSSAVSSARDAVQRGTRCGTGGYYGGSESFLGRNIERLLGSADPVGNDERDAFREIEDSLRCGGGGGGIFGSLRRRGGGKGSPNPADPSSSSSPDGGSGRLTRAPRKVVRNRAGESVKARARRIQRLLVGRTLPPNGDGGRGNNNVGIHSAGGGAGAGGDGTFHAHRRRNVAAPLFPSAAVPSSTTNISSSPTNHREEPSARHVSMSLDTTASTAGADGKENSAMHNNNSLLLVPDGGNSKDPAGAAAAAATTIGETTMDSHHSNSLLLETSVISEARTMDDDYDAMDCSEFNSSHHHHHGHGHATNGGASRDSSGGGAAASSSSGTGGRSDNPADLSRLIGDCIEPIPTVPEDHGMTSSSARAGGDATPVKNNGHNGGPGGGEEQDLCYDSDPGTDPAARRSMFGGAATAAPNTGAKEVEVNRSLNEITLSPVRATAGSMGGGGHRRVGRGGDSDAKAGSNVHPSIIQDSLNETLTLTWHPPTTPTNTKMSSPRCVQLWIERGQRLDSDSNRFDDMIEPRIVWRDAYHPSSGADGRTSRRRMVSSMERKPKSITLLSICRILETTKGRVDRGRYPLAKASTSFLVRTCGDSEYLFEARTVEERDSIIRKWKTVVARLASLAIVSNGRALGREFFGDSPSEGGGLDSPWRVMQNVPVVQRF